MSAICSKLHANRFWLVFAVAIPIGVLMPDLVAAQSVTIDLGNGATVTGRAVQLFLLMTVLSLAPGIAIMVTCFPFMVT